MPKHVEHWYLEALSSLNLADVARTTGRGYRTLHAYLRRERRVTREAARELVEYLRHQAHTFVNAAERIETALREEKDHE